MNGSSPEKSPALRAAIAARNKEEDRALVDGFLLNIPRIVRAKKGVELSKYSRARFEGNFTGSLMASLVLSILGVPVPIAVLAPAGINAANEAAAHIIKNRKKPTH